MKRRGKKSTIVDDEKSESLDISFSPIRRSPLKNVSIPLAQEEEKIPSFREPYFETNVDEVLETSKKDTSMSTMSNEAEVVEVVSQSLEYQETGWSYEKRMLFKQFLSPKKGEVGYIWIGNYNHYNLIPLSWYRKSKVKYADMFEFFEATDAFYENFTSPKVQFNVVYAQLLLGKTAVRISIPLLKNNEIQVVHICLGYLATGDPPSKMRLLELLEYNRIISEIDDFQETPEQSVADLKSITPTLPNFEKELLEKLGIHLQFPSIALVDQYLRTFLSFTRKRAMNDEDTMRILAPFIIFYRICPDVFGRRWREGYVSLTAPLNIEMRDFYEGYEAVFNKREAQDLLRDSIEDYIQQYKNNLVKGISTSGPFSNRLYKLMSTSGYRNIEASLPYNRYLDINTDKVGPVFTLKPFYSIVKQLGKEDAKDINENTNLYAYILYSLQRIARNERMRLL